MLEGVASRLFLARVRARACAQETVLPVGFDLAEGGHGVGSRCRRAGERPCPAARTARGPIRIIWKSRERDHRIRGLFSTLRMDCGVTSWEVVENPLVPPTLG